MLAGGQSRRMGQDKALLRLQGEVLLTRTCRQLLSVCAGQPILVITTRPSYQTLLPPGCNLILETAPQGPLLAFARGLNQLLLAPQPIGQQQQRSDWVLLLACDLPLLTVADLETAIARLAQLPDSVEAYLPPAALRSAAPAETTGVASRYVAWEPLCGFYRQRCLPSLQTAIQNGDRAFQPWLKRLNIVPIAQWPPAHLLNCNRPEDWQRVQQICDQPD